MANKIMYKDQVLVDFDNIKNRSIEILTPQSGSIYPEINHVYRQVISSNTNIVLPGVTDNTVFSQIIIQIEVSGSPNISLGTTYYYGTLPTLSAGKYKLIYDYDGANWVLEVKTEQ